MDNCHKYFNIFNNYSELGIPDNTVYFYGLSPEDRSNEIVKFEHTFDPTNIRFCQLRKLDGEDIIEIVRDNKKINLRSLKEISNFIDSHQRENIYIDVTGLDNRICAPLIKQSIEYCNAGKAKTVRVIYSEPIQYNVQKFKAEGVFSDLSEKIEGIDPLPGFVKVFPNEGEVFLIALLGFEGGRFIHLIENVECTNKNIIPVVGLPGFRFEYPHIAFWGNRKPLKETESWRNIKYASANSAVEVYFLLKDILNNNPTASLKIAPIGTKPHAIGAMIFATKFTNNTELIYDNPIRKAKKTEGVGKVIECYVNELLEEN